MAEQPKSLEAMVAAYPRQPSSQEGVPWRRYNLPRRSFQNPYLSGEAPASSPLHIDHQASYRTVLREFLVYSSSKLGNTPRLPAGVSRGLNRLLRWAINRLG